MWWFTRQKDAPQTATSVHWARQAEDQLLALTPDIAALTAQQDVAIKIWLPESVARTVKLLATHDGDSQSAWLRDRLVGYVYGHVAERTLRIRRTRTPPDTSHFARKPVDRTQGRWIYKAPQLGKNIIAFKLWVSEQMRADLQTLAHHAQVPLSAFVREAIIGDLFGRASLPERPELMGQPSPAAQAWERGETVPMLELPQEPLDALGVLEQVWQTQD